LKTDYTGMIPPVEERQYRKCISDYEDDKDCIFCLTDAFKEKVCLNPRKQHRLVEERPFNVCIYHITIDEVIEAIDTGMIK